jgi:exodeoxyribonuclease VII large subunit
VDRAEGRIAALFRRLDQRLDDLNFGMEAGVAGLLRRRRSEVSELTAAVLRHDPRQRLGLARERLAACRTRLDRSLERALQTSTTRVSALHARLHALSPLAVLDRGFALVQGADGVLVRSVAQLAPGDRVTTRLSDGTFTSRVETLDQANPRKKNKTHKK